MPLDDPTTEYLKSVQAPDPKALVDFYAQKYGVDPAFAHRIAQQESGYNQKALSDKGAIGVMQLMPLTAAGLGVDPHDVHQNIEGGIRYLKQHLDKYKGDQRLAAAAYNAGPDAVDKYGGVPPYEQTQNYVKIVAQDPTTSYLQSQQSGQSTSAPAPTDASQVIDPTAKYLANKQMKTTSTAKPKTPTPSYQQLTPEAITKGITRSQGVHDNSIGQQLQVLNLNSNLLNAFKKFGPRLQELEAKKSAYENTINKPHGYEYAVPLTDVETHELNSLHQSMANAQEEYQNSVKPQRIGDLTSVATAPDKSKDAALAAFVQKHGALTRDEQKLLGLPTNYLAQLPVNIITGLGQAGLGAAAGFERMVGSPANAKTLQDWSSQAATSEGVFGNQELPGAIGHAVGGLIPPIALSTALPGIAPELAATGIIDPAIFFSSSALEHYGQGASGEESIKAGLESLLPIAGAKFIGGLAIGGPTLKLAQRIGGNAFANGLYTAANKGDSKAIWTSTILGGFMGAGHGESMDVPDDIIHKAVLDPTVQSEVGKVIASEYDPKAGKMLFQRAYPKLEAKLGELGLTPEQSSEFIDNVKASAEPTTTQGETASQAATTPSTPPPVEDATTTYLKENQNATQQVGQQASLPVEHQEGDRSGQTPEAGSGNRLLNETTDAKEGEVIPPPPPPITPTTLPAPDEASNLVGIKNEFLESQAERRQEPLPSTEPQRRDFETVIQEGKNRVDSGKINPMNLAEEIKNKPRSLTPEESAAMIYYHTQLLNEEAVHLKAVQDAKAANDPIALSNARVNLDQVKSELSKTREANKLSNYEKGLSLAINKAMLDEDYSLARMEQRAIAAKRGKDLTPKEKAELEDTRNEILKDQENQEAFDERKSKGEASKTVDQLKKETQAERKSGRAKKKGDLDAEFTQQKAALAALFKKDTTPNAKKGIGGPEAGAIDPEMLRLPLDVAKVLKAMAKNRIAAGVNSLDGVVDAVHGAASEFGEFTKRQVRDAISGYGRLAKLSKDPLDIKMRELNRIGRLISAIEDAEKGQSPLKSGVPRDADTPQIRDLRKQLAKAMKENGLEIERQPRSSEDQMKSSMDAAKTRLRNEIDDLNKQITEGVKVKPTTKLNYDQETRDLMYQRDALKRQLSDPTAKNKADVQTRLNDVEQRLKNGDLGRKADFPSTVYDDAETTAMRAKLKEANRQLNEQRALPDKLNDLEAKKAEVQRRINEHDYSKPQSAGQPNRPAPPEIVKARAELKDLNKQLSSARAEANKIGDLQDRIAELQRRIREKDFSAAPKGPARADSSEVAGLKAQRDDLNKQLQGLRPASPLSDAQRLDIGKKAAKRAYDEYQRRIAEKDFSRKQSGTEVTDPEFEQLKAQRDKAKEEYQNLHYADPQVIADKNAQQLKTYKERLAKRQAELDNQIETEKFYTNDKGQQTTSKPKNKLQLDAEAEQLKANTARSKVKAEAIIRRIDEENRTKGEKAIALAPKFFEGVKLSSSLVIGKLTGFGAARVMLLDPMEGLISAIDRFNPATKAIHEASYAKGGRGQSTAGDYVSAVGDLWKNYANIFKHWEIIRGRHTDLDLKYGKPNELPVEMLGVFRRVHKMLKNPVVEAEFNRYNKGYLRVAQGQGLDISDPRVILESGMKSYAEAYRDILLGKNRASDAFSQKVGELGRGSVSDQIIAAGFRSALPIVKVPINYALEESSYGLGSIKGAGLLFNKGYAEGKATNTPVRNAVKAMFGQGLKSLTPDEAQQVLRAYHKQGVGMALMALGYFGYKSIGGYYVSAADEESRRGKGQPLAGQTHMFGVPLPSTLTHNPAFEAMQGMATFHHALDYYKHKAGSDSILDPALTTIRGSLEHIPFYEEPARAFRGLESGQKATDFIGNELRGAVIPPDFQRAARIWDQREPQNSEGVAQTVPLTTKLKEMAGIGSPNTKKRKSKGSAIHRVWQQIEQGVPLLRQNVPLKP